MDLGELAWYFLTVACLAAVGFTRDLARRKKNRKYLILAVAPVAWLTYVVGLLAFRIAVDVYRHLAETVFGVWALATYCLWERGNEYKRQVDRLEEQLSAQGRAAEARN